MVNKKIINILPRMTTNLNNNIRIINEEFKDLNYIDDNNKSLLHIFIQEKNKESDTMLAIKSLLKCGKLNPNLKDINGYNFIQTALIKGYSEDFVLELIKITINNTDTALDINTVDNEGNTIVHTAIESDEYNQDFIRIYKLLCENGFDSFIVNKKGKNIYNTAIEATLEKGKLFGNQLNLLQQIFETSYEEEKNINNISITKEDLTKIEKLGTILNKKNFITNPAFGREKEIESLIVNLASEKTSPLVIGDSGVGKTVLIEELAYRIINEQVPDYLKKRIVLEVNPNELVAGTMYAGSFEEKIKTLMELCVKYNIILFIDGIYSIYGTGTHDNSKIDMASMLSSYMKRQGAKIIGTTTIEEYNEYFATSSLKGSFNVIKVSEPDYNTLYQIIEKTINDYGYKTNINVNKILNTNIIDLLIEVTSKKVRLQNDNINNPSLVVSIIDMAFAYAKVDNSKVLTKEHFIKSLNVCERIYPSTRQKVIDKLNYSNNDYDKNNSKVLKIDFTTRR